MDLVENGTDDEEYELLHKIVLDGVIKKYITFFYQLVILMLRILTNIVTTFLSLLLYHIPSKEMYQLMINVSNRNIFCK